MHIRKRFDRFILLSLCIYLCLLNAHTHTHCQRDIQRALSTIYSHLSILMSTAETTVKLNKYGTERKKAARTHSMNVWLCIRTRSLIATDRLSHSFALALPQSHSHNCNLTHDHNSCLTYRFISNCFSICLFAIRTTIVQVPISVYSTERQTSTNCICEKKLKSFREFLSFFLLYLPFFQSIFSRLLLHSSTSLRTITFRFFLFPCQIEKLFISFVLLN